MVTSINSSIFLPSCVYFSTFNKAKVSLNDNNHGDICENPMTK